MGKSRESFLLANNAAGLVTEIIVCEMASFRHLPNAHP